MSEYIEQIAKQISELKLELIPYQQLLDEQNDLENNFRLVHGAFTNENSKTFEYKNIIKFGCENKILLNEANNIKRSIELLESIIILQQDEDFFEITRYLGCFKRPNNNYKNDYAILYGIYNNFYASYSSRKIIFDFVKNSSNRKILKHYFFIDDNCYLNHFCTSYVNDEINEELIIEVFKICKELGKSSINNFLKYYFKNISKTTDQFNVDLFFYDKDVNIAFYLVKYNKLQLLKMYLDYHTEINLDNEYLLRLHLDISENFVISENW